jgi:polyisoprenoid-binding protein YceI
MSWTIDPSHSEITFNVRHMMITNVRGRMERFTGMIDFDEENPALSTVDVQIEAASVNTRDAQRDAHLRSADFFNADTYPYLTFKSQRVEVIDDDQGRIYGDLTIRDITRPVTLDVTYNGLATSPWGQAVAGFSVTTKINRQDWGLTWNVPLANGGVLVGEKITLSLEVELIKQEEAVPA